MLVGSEVCNEQPRFGRAPEDCLVSSRVAEIFKNNPSSLQTPTSHQLPDRDAEIYIHWLIN